MYGDSVLQFLFMHFFQGPQGPRGLQGEMGQPGHQVWCLELFWRNSRILLKVIHLSNTLPVFLYGYRVVPVLMVWLVLMELRAIE